MTSEARALEGQEGLAGWSVTSYSDHWRLALLSYIGVIHPVMFGNAGILSAAGWGGSQLPVSEISSSPFAFLGE